MGHDGYIRGSGATTHCACGAEAPRWRHKMSCYATSQERAAMETAVAHHSACTVCGFPQGTHVVGCTGTAPVAMWLPGLATHLRVERTHHEGETRCGMVLDPSRVTDDLRRVNCRRCLRSARHRKV